MKKGRLFAKCAVNFLVLGSYFFAVTPFDSIHADLATADTPESAPVQTDHYTKTFTISAYYSPLPCQNRYATGSYEADIRLNGRGTNGADGTPVYPGMVAAPKSYAFGTKMQIPGIGVVAVHDRGGAIVAANGDPTKHDRLDVWMGFGDVGLKRALTWGKRNVDVTVLGFDSSYKEEISLMGFSAEESIPSCGGAAPAEPVTPTPQVTTAPAVVTPPVVNQATQAPPTAGSELIQTELKKGDQGEEVVKLQKELAKLSYFKGDFTGYFGPLTEHSVFKFQQSQGLVGVDKNSPWAGVFGVKTKSKLNTILKSKKFVAQIKRPRDGVYVASTGDTKIATELDFGVVHEDVKDLQKVLKEKGYFDAGLFTDYFGEATRDALVKFQIANGIVKSDSDKGAGRVGPKTMEVLNQFT